MQRTLKGSPPSADADTPGKARPCDAAAEQRGRSPDVWQRREKLGVERR